MAKYIILSFFLLCAIQTFAQDSLLVGKRYKEDQFYMNFTYNSLLNPPKEIIQNGLSIGIHMGYFYDYQFSVDGKWAMGLGLGYAYDKIHSNLVFSNSFDEFVIIPNNLKKRKIESHSIELPIELRYRTSSPVNYKFWRIYFGGKVAYTFLSKNVYELEGENFKIKHLPHFEKWQYGPQVSFGYNTWNIYANWNINPLFSKNNNDNTLKLNEITNLKVGLQFYIF